MNTSPTLVTPVLGVASATSLATSAASPLLLTNGQLTTIALTSQTIGATTLTIPDFASVSDTFVFNTKAATLSNKTFVAPALGTPASGVATNLTGTAAGLTAGNVTTNANLTGPITSVGNATSIAAQTGTGTTFVVNTSPTLVTPVLGVASATSLATSAASPLLLTNGQLTTIALTSQTIGATTLTIPDFASVSDTFVFNTKAATLSNKTFVAPALGTPASGVATNLTGTAAGLTAGNVTTNANLTGPITSVGNATSIAAQTGTGTTFVMNTSPTITTSATVLADDASNTTVTYLQRLSHTTSGVPAAGIGTGLEFEAETSAANNEIGASLAAVVTDATLASEDFDLVFKNMAAGAAAAE